jgi:lysophospholipase L1-like esterase
MATKAEELRKLAQTIKNETQVGGNTAERVGSAFEGVADALDGTEAINEIEQAVAKVQQMVDNLPVVQQTGNSTTSVMSQKAVTDITVCYDAGEVADLAAAIKAVPPEMQKGGLTLFFTPTGSSEKLSYFLASKSWTTEEKNWESTNQRITFIEDQVFETVSMKEDAFDDDFYWNINTGKRRSNEYFAATAKISLFNVKKISTTLMGSGTSVVANVCFFKEDGALLDATNLPNGTWTKEVEIPSDASYVAFTTNKAGKGSSSITLIKTKPASIADGAVTAGKIADGAVTAGKIADGAVTADKVVTEKIDYEAQGRELFTVGGFIYKDGNLRTNADYSYTEFLSIPVIKQIGLRACQVGNSYMAFVAFYDKDKKFLSALSNVGSTQSGDYDISVDEIPLDTKYVRVSSNKTSYNNDTCRVIYSNATYLKGTLSEQQNRLSECETNIKNIDSKLEQIGGKFSSFRASDNLAKGDILTLQPIHIEKNILLVAKITGSVNDIEVGVGYSESPTFANRDYGGRWLKVTATSVSMYASYNQTSFTPMWTEAHGIVLTEKTTIEISQGVTDMVSKIRIYDDMGNVYEKDSNEWGYGLPFIINNGESSIHADLSFFPMDINKSIWVFGDSYMSFTNPARWPYYMRQKGFTNWLSNNQAGLSPSSGVSDLKSLLSLGYYPKYIMWMLGMNGDTVETKVDGEYVINSYQKSNLDKMIAICKEYNIEPVIATIPTTPAEDSITPDSGLSNAAGRQKTGYCKYVKSLGYRYIDQAEAVGTDENGNWNAGLLSSDFVHPTEKGAKVLLSRILLDFPEISITE